MKVTRPAIRQNVSRRSVLGLLGFGAATAALTPTFLKTARAQNQKRVSSPAKSTSDRLRWSTALCCTDLDLGA